MSDGKMETYHSKSLYMIVKKTCKKRLTAFMRTANRYSHASPDIIDRRQQIHTVESKDLASRLTRKGQTQVSAKPRGGWEMLEVDAVWRGWLIELDSDQAWN